MIAIDQYTRTGRRVIDMRRPSQVVGGGTFDIRGERALFKAVTDRAYWKEAEEEEHEADEIVPPGTAYNAGTMYLYPTWDCIRWPEPES